MLVLHINAVYGIRSTGRTVKERHEYLLRNGIGSVVAFSEGEKISNSFIFDSKIEKKLHGLLSRITGLQGYYSKYSTLKLIKFIENNKPDVIHIGNLHSNFINMPILFEYIAKNDIATIITLHDCWFYTGGHSHYVLDNYYAWRDGFSNYMQNRKLMGNKSWFFDRSKKIYFDQIKWFGNIPRVQFVGVSDWITKEAKKSKITYNSPVKRIYNWIDLNKFKPTNVSSKRRKLKIENKFVILGVASLFTKSKGIDSFIKLSQVINEDEMIILVGSIPNKLSLPKNILHIPETANIEELVELYSLADVFVNFSIEESFGKVSAEALACGTPIITNGYTANPELIGPRCGYIVENFEDILIKIKTIREKGKKYYTTSCVNFASSNFSMENNLAKYLEIYNSLLDV